MNTFIISGYIWKAFFIQPTYQLIYSYTWVVSIHNLRLAFHCLQAHNILGILIVRWRALKSRVHIIFQVFLLFVGSWVPALQVGGGEQVHHQCGCIPPRADWLLWKCIVLAQANTRISGTLRLCSCITEVVRVSSDELACYASSSSARPNYFQTKKVSKSMKSKNSFWG
jgi:hypothetical protein